MLQRLLLTTILFMSCAGAQAAFGQPKSGYPSIEDMPFEELNRPPMWLVRARALDVVNTLSETRTHFVITEVYVGPKSILGSEWYSRSSRAGDSTGYYVLPAVQPRQEVICTIKWNFANTDSGLIDSPTLEDELNQADVVVFDRPYGMNRFVVLDGGGEAKSAMEQAVAVSKVYHAPSDKLQGIVADYARGKTGLTPAWAMGVLAYWKTPKGNALLWQLAHDPNRPISQSIALDDALMRAERESWKACPLRLTLLHHLCTGKLNTTDSGAVLSHLISQTRTPDTLPHGEITQLFAAFIANRFVAPNDRVIACSTPGPLVEEKILSNREAFDFWTEILTDPKQRALAVEAKRNLATLLSSDEQTNPSSTWTAKLPLLEIGPKMAPIHVVSSEADAERAKSIAAISDILRQPDKNSAQTAAAIKIAGILRADEVVDVLVDNIDFLQFGIPTEWGLSPKSSYWAVDALIRIGTPAIKPILKRLGTETNPSDQFLLIFVIEEIEGKTVGKFILEQAIGDADTPTKEFLQKAMDVAISRRIFS